MEQIGFRIRNSYARRIVSSALSALLILSLMVSVLPQPVSAAETSAGFVTGGYRYATAVGSSDNDSRFIYSDDYFLKSPYEEDAHLATLSMAAASASVSSSETDYAGSDRNILNILTSMGFQDAEANADYTVKPTENTIGAAAAHKTIRTAEGDTTLLAVFPRSAGYEAEWAGNFTIGAEGWHEGFAAAATKVLSFAADYVKRMGISGNVKVWIAGYSRGGGIANIAGGMLDDDENLLGVTVKPENLYVYTFAASPGTPSEYNPGDAKYGNIRNYLTDYDLFPQIPPAQWKLKRYGTDHYFAVHDADAKARMLSCLKENDPALYEKYVSEDSSVDPDGFQAMNLNTISKIFNGGPIFIPDNSGTTLTNLPQKEFLESRLEYIASTILPDRKTYTDEYQASLQTLLAALMSMSSKQQTKFLEEVKKDRLTLYFTVTSFHQYFYDSRHNESAATRDLGYSVDYLTAILKPALLSAGVSKADAEKVVQPEVLKPFIKFVANFLMGRENTEETDGYDIMSTFAGNISRILTPHLDCVLLSWLESEDSYYSQGNPVYAAVKAYPVSGGTASGGGILHCGSGTTLTAVPSDGWHFVKWIRDGADAGTSSSLTLENVAADTSCTALFGQDAAPEPSNPPIVIPASSKEGTVEVEAVVSGSKADISITQQQVKEIISNTQSTGTVRVDISSLAADEAVLPKELVSASAASGTCDGLEVSMKTGSVKLDKAALAAVGSSTLTVEVKTVASSGLSEEQKKALGNEAADAIIVDVNVLVNGVKTSAFGGGSISIGIPYPAESIKTNAHPAVWYLADDGKPTRMEGTWDAAQGLYIFNTLHLSRYALAEVSLQRMSGADRYDTMNLAVAAAFDKCDTAVLSSGEDWPDALAAAPLAGALDCPVLLTDPQKLSSQTEKLLENLGVTKVYIVGGTSAVSSDIEETLASGSIGSGNVIRLGGESRTETAEKIASAVMQKSSADTCLICSGKNFPDALSVSAYAYARQMPILLTDSSGNLGKDTQAMAGKFKKAVIIGGYDAVSSAAESQLASLSVSRISGADRYGTSEAIIQTLYSGILPEVAAVTGENFPDALVSASFAGKSGGAVLLLNGGESALSDGQKSILRTAADIRIIGGESAVSEGTAEAAAAAVK